VYGADVNYLLLRDARYDAEAWLETHAREGAKVEAYSGPVYLPRFPSHVNVRRSRVTAADLAGLDARAPDFLVLTSAVYRHFESGSEQAALATRLLAGDYGYRPVRTFQTEPLLSPRLFAGLSPEIVVLAKRAP
jgi:hypothetical protein